MSEHTIPSAVFVTKYVQKYIERFNKCKDLPGGVIESYTMDDSHLHIKIFMPSVMSIGSKKLPWDEVLSDAQELGVAA